MTFAPKGKGIKPERDLLGKLLIPKSQQPVDELLERCRPLLKAMVSGKIDAKLQAKIDPSDVVQEACMDLMKATGRLPAEKPERFASYLRRVIMNRLYDIRRKFVSSQKRNISREQHSTSMDLGELVDTNSNSADILQKIVDDEMLKRLRNSLSTLPFEVKKIIYLRFVKDMTYEDIGSRVRRSGDDVRMLVKRWLLRLKQEIRSESQSSSDA